MKNAIKTFKILALALSLLITAGSAHAKKDFTIEEIEQYLSSFHSFYAKFDQVVLNESFSKGEVYIQKPGKFLWQYIAPDRVRIISNGGLVYFEDQQNGQTTQVPSAGFLFSLLSRENISFATSKVIINEFNQTNNRISIHLTATVGNKKVPVSLIFEKKPNDSLALMKIISINQLDQTMIISLYEQNHKANINPKIFKVDVEENEYKN